MSAKLNLFIVAFIICTVSCGCSSQSVFPADKQPFVNNEVETQTPILPEVSAVTSISVDPVVEDSITEEEFVQSLIQAINEHNIEFLSEYLQNGYTVTTSEMLSQGLELYDFLCYQKALTS